MEPEKRARLAEKGWVSGTVAEFLELTPDESAEVEALAQLDLMRASLANVIRETRQGRLTQTDLAKRIKSNQGRIARIEAADKSVSLDLMVEAALACGVAPIRIGEAFSIIPASGRHTVPTE